jgi:hypothetical protein
MALVGGKWVVCLYWNFSKEVMLLCYGNKGGLWLGLDLIPPRVFLSMRAEILTLDSGLLTFELGRWPLIRPFIHLSGTTKRSPQ